MNENYSETLSFRTKPEVKTLVENMVNEGYLKKSDLIEEALKALAEKQQKQAEPQPQKLEVVPSSEPVNQVFDEPEASKTEPEESEIRIKLTPVQLFALKETVLHEKFVQLSNNTVKKVDNGENNLFTSDIYSGAFKGIFSEMTPDFENEQIINENMGKALINVFMATIVSGGIEIDSPVNKRLVKEFLSFEQ